MEFTKLRKLVEGIKCSGRKDKTQVQEITQAPLTNVFPSTSAEKQKRKQIPLVFRDSSGFFVVPAVDK